MGSEPRQLVTPTSSLPRISSLDFPAPSVNTSQDLIPDLNDRLIDEPTQIHIYPPNVNYKNFLRPDNSHSVRLAS